MATSRLRRCCGRCCAATFSYTTGLVVLSLLNSLFGFVTMRVVPASIFVKLTIAAFAVLLILSLATVATRHYKAKRRAKAERVKAERVKAERAKAKQAATEPEQAPVESKAVLDVDSQQADASQLPHVSDGLRHRNSSSSLPSVSASPSPAPLPLPLSLPSPADTARDAQAASKSRPRRAALARRAIYGVLLIWNVLVLAWTLDFAFRPTYKPRSDLVFARVGDVGPQHALVFVRHPSAQGQIRVRARAVSSTAVSAAAAEVVATASPPTADDDYTTTVRLDGLVEGTEYAITVGHAGGEIASLAAATWPAPGAPTRFAFGTGSCIKPNFPYAPFGNTGIRGFRLMSKVQQQRQQKSPSLAMSFVLFLGDFIYSDLPYLYGTTLEHYRRLYRQVYWEDDTRQLVSAVPMLHMYDDHEIKNNWDSGTREPFPAAMRAYLEYNGRPSSPNVTSFDSPGYYNFTRGDTAFYVMDCRRYRTGTELGPFDAAKSFLGATQKQHFMEWLGHVNHTAAVKFVACGDPFTVNWAIGDANQDLWRGYRVERKQILDAVKDVPNTYLLSGDRHEVAVVMVDGHTPEFSTSPVNQFYVPLVNTLKDQPGELDRTVLYQRVGNSKFAVIDVDTETNRDAPKVTYNLYTEANDADAPLHSIEFVGRAWRSA